MNDDYDKWYADWVKSWEEHTNKEEPKNVYSFKPKNNQESYKDRVVNYYEWTNEFFDTKNLKANLNVKVSESYLDKFETALAKVDIALDNLLNYLHDKKNS